MPFTASVLLLAYNQRPLVRAAAESVLQQDCEPIEVILSDDASIDGTYEEMTVVAAAYAGPHRVVVRRNNRNLGIGEHINTLVNISRGELLVIAAGDDVSEPQRVRALLDAWNASGRQLDLIASAMTSMDESGRRGNVIPVDDLARWHTVQDWVAQRPYVVGAAHAWTKRLFKRFGPLLPEIAYEDQVMTFRALCGGGAMTLEQPLVRYRSGGTSARSRTQGAQERLRRTELQNRRHLAELEQLLADAGLTPQHEIVQAALQPELEKQRYLHDLLTASDWWQFALSTFSPKRPSPLSWRLRKSWAVGSARLRAGSHAG